MNLLTTGGAAKLLGLSRQRVLQLVHEKKLVAIAAATTGTRPIFLFDHAAVMALAPGRRR